MMGSYSRPIERARGGALRTAMVALLSLLMAAAFVSMGMESAASAPGEVLLVSSNASGVQADDDVGAPAISSDGRCVTFYGYATNLVPTGSTDPQVFHKDLQSGTVKLCSASASGTTGNSYAAWPDITWDGRYVAFHSDSTNLVAAAFTATQVFRKDVQTGAIELVSCSASGTPGDPYSQNVSISSDGRYAAFESVATNLGPTTTAFRTNIFRKDLQTGEVKLVSCNASGTEGDNDSEEAEISPDGRYVVFDSEATNLVPGGTTHRQIFRKDLQTGEVKLVSCNASGVEGDNDIISLTDLSISSDGRYVSFASYASNLIPGGTSGGQVFRKDLQTNEVVLVSCNASGTEGNDESYETSMSMDGRYVAIESVASNLVPGGTTPAQGNVFRKDLQTGEMALVSSDYSGVEANDWSYQPAMAPEGDYIAFGSVATNLVSGVSGEQVFRKDYTTPSTFYFAEGYTGGGFQEYLCLGNPNDEGTFATITYLFPDGTTQEQEVELAANSRLTVNVNDVVGADKQVSAVVGCDVPIVAERPMYFEYQGQWTGGHDVVGADSTADMWYFAEGYTGSGFDEWICVLNPGDTAAELTFRFQTQEEGEKTVTGFSVPAHSRQSFKANDLLEGGSYQTSLALESTQPVVAERPMYFNYQGTGGWGWTGGHCVVGASELATDYFFAEGTTRPGFEEWLTIQNPGLAEINVHATYFLGSGEPVEMDYPVPPARRSTIYVPDQVGTEKDVSVALASPAPFLAERPMYFAYQGMGAWGWTGGHCVIGATASANDWFFAEGYTGSGFEEWLCIQNPGGTDAALNVTYYPEGGADPVVREHTVAANSRYTIPVNVDAGADMTISAGISSNQPVICERPMYFNFQGMWSGGHDVLGFTP